MNASLVRLDALDVSDLRDVNLVVTFWKLPRDALVSACNKVGTRGV